MTPPREGWSDWEKALWDKVDALEARVNETREDVAALKAFASFWGGLAGVVTSVVVWLIRGNSK